MKHLEEYRTLLATGYEYSTSICGKTLKMMLQEYGAMMLSGMLVTIIIFYYFQFVTYCPTCQYSSVTCTTIYFSFTLCLHKAFPFRGGKYSLL